MFYIERHIQLVCGVWSLNTPSQVYRYNNLVDHKYYWNTLILMTQHDEKHLSQQSSITWHTNEDLPLERQLKETKCDRKRQSIWPSLKPF